MMQRAEPDDIVLILRPLADSIEPAIRLRQALKVLLRCFGLRCMSIGPMGGPVNDRGIEAASTAAEGTSHEQT